MNPQIGFLLNKSLESLKNSNLESAELYLKQAIRLQKNNPHVLRLLGVVAAKKKQYADAVDYLNSSLKIFPKNALTYSNLGNVFFEIKEYIKAIDAYKKSIKLEPNYEEAWLNMGNTLSELKQYEDALFHYDKALVIRPDYTEAFLNKGSLLIELKRHEEALTNYNYALSLRPEDPIGLINKGFCLNELKRFDEAITHYDKAISLRPNDTNLWVNKGFSLNELKRFDEAIAHYDKAISLNPDYTEAFLNKGVSLMELRHFDEALVCYDQIIGLKPDHIKAWSNKADVLSLCKQHIESAKCYLKAFALSAGECYFLGRAHHQMMLVCDWTDYEKITNQIFTQIRQEKKSADPFGFQGIANSEELIKKCAEIYTRDKYPMLGNLSENSKYTHHKIRIGYLCGEFREHATSILMARVWEMHDQAKFEIFAFDSGWDDHTPYRHRLENAFSNFFDISRLSDLDAAKLIFEKEIDILVNLNGFFGFGRQGVFSYKPAPIQVNYLGFPGTLGAAYIDYMIADRIVLPELSQEFYIEKIVYLPNSYQANDNQRIISKRQFSKTELGLPKNYFVFACFNNNYKIVPSTFDLWSRILLKVEGSVLWLLAENPTIKENLIKEVVARGIDSNRLIFAHRIEPSEHLARHQFADLFLDTLPYNAHTTASDALWAGLPVLTLMGNTFPGKVAASLLNAIGLPELITSSESEYESLAIELATKPHKLNIIKKKLAKNRLTTPLFNTPLFTKNIETAYFKMVERHQANLKPDHIEIAS